MSYARLRAGWSLDQLSYFIKMTTVFRWVFATALVTAFIVRGFDLPLQKYFSEGIIEILLRTTFLIEACYWATKYRKLSLETGKK